MKSASYTTSHCEKCLNHRLRLSNGLAPTFYRSAMGKWVSHQLLPGMIDVGFDRSCSGCHKVATRSWEVMAELLGRMGVVPKRWKNLYG